MYDIVKITIDGVEWGYKTHFNSYNVVDSYRLYDSSGAFVAEFFGLDECIMYAVQKSMEKKSGNVINDNGSLKDLQAKIQSVFMQRFEKLMGGRSYKQFADFIGLKKSSVYDYANGIRFPVVAALVRISEKCNVSVDWLIGKE